ncbi:hypothetical protein L3Q82_007677 [Scortum barcoo]|uniref:Uncharacterized protein n=1 Tax=Scortum barcoo TaxID=214431 RepID=A0ACB8WPE5_9TELE|nr:hypothetical protein L3Q82_007677 [Scortum barcoo]
MLRCEVRTGQITEEQVLTWYILQQIVPLCLESVLRVERSNTMVGALRQLLGLRMIPGLCALRDVACLHRALESYSIVKQGDSAVGGLRWKSSYRQAPLLTAAPVRPLIDEQISIKAHFLPPHCPVTVCAQMHSEDGDLWEAFAHYNSNADGTVNLTMDESVGGSYLGLEPMGLFWGLQPAPGSREGRGPFPAMLDLWGMGGGLMEYRSALLASRGYASLSLAYFGHQDLPSPVNRINVGDSYFKSAFRLLQDHHQVIADRVGIIGLSFGAYLTLRIATQCGVKPSCLICINGPVGSTVKLLDEDGKTDSFESDQKYWLYDDQGHVSFKNVSLPENMSPKSIVKIEETLRAAGKSHLFTRLSYPGAGHLIEPPYMPNSRVSLWSVKPQKRITLWGGHPAPHAHAQEDAWKKILGFMEINLRR